MKLFSDKERSNTKPIELNQNLIDYLDSTSSSWAKNIREYLNEWIQKYPENEFNELVKRMKKNIEPSFFELFLHELMTQMGFQLKIHPTMLDVSTKPDFLVFNDESEFILEAKLITEMTDKERKYESKQEWFEYQINDNVKSNNFFLNITFVEFSNNAQSSLKPLYIELQNFIDSNDPDIITQNVFKDRELGKFSYKDNYITTEMRLIPKIKSSRNEVSDRIIGISGSKGKFIDTQNSIKSGLSKKSGKYGNLSKPLIIGINLTSPFGFYDDEVEESLYGSTLLNLDSRKSKRRSNGFFGTSNNQKHTRISGVLVSNVHYASVHKSRIRYYKNPYALNEYSFNGLIDEISFEKDHMAKIEGKKLQELLKFKEKIKNSHNKVQNVHTPYAGVRSSARSVRRNKVRIDHSLKSQSQ